MSPKKPQRVMPVRKSKPPKETISGGKTLRNSNLPEVTGTKNPNQPEVTGTKNPNQPEVTSTKKSSEQVQQKRNQREALSPKKSNLSPKKARQPVTASSVKVKPNERVLPKKSNSVQENTEKKPTPRLVPNERVLPKKSNSVEENTEKKEKPSVVNNNLCQTQQKSFSMISASFYELFINSPHADYDADSLSESDDEEEEVPTIIQTRSGQENPNEDNDDEDVTIVQTLSGQESSNEADVTEDLGENKNSSLSPNHSFDGDDSDYSVSERESDVSAVLSFESDEEHSMEDGLEEYMESDEPIDEIPAPPADTDTEILSNPNMIDIFNNTDGNDEEEFKSLINSDLSSDLMAFQTNDFNASIKCMKYCDMELQSSFPGVSASAFHKFKNVSIGFLRIGPKTVKPFERAANISIVYTVMEGEVILKSNAFEIIDNRRVLQKTLVKVGTSLNIPEGHPYALENRTDYDAVLQYVVIQ